MLSDKVIYGDRSLLMLVTNFCWLHDIFSLVFLVYILIIISNNSNIPKFSLILLFIVIYI